MEASSNIKIRRQNRKSLLMKLTASGIMVYIPRWLDRDDPQVQAFIADGLKKLEGHLRVHPREQQLSVEALLAMVDTWAALIGVQPSRVRLRTMYSRWGSCSSKGNINLNRSLCYLPPHLAEYVVCHELVHLRIFNHSKAFKDMMSQYMPDWKAREQELKGYHP
jgi:predicted metal-dependent hydrolase